MINKSESEKLIEEGKFVEVIDEFYIDCFEKIKEVLDFFKIKYEDNITLIECISLIDTFVPNGEIITYFPVEIFFVESREIDSRARFALNWYDTWLVNLEEIKK